MKLSNFTFSLLLSGAAATQPPTEIRTYTLATVNATNQYAEIWKKHIVSLEKFNITTRGVWRPTTSDTQIVALCQYAMGDDPATVTAAYMSSTEFTQDMEGFNMSDIQSVVTYVLDPLSFSPIL